ncbi:hypothetical protein NQ318_012065 [Aromia moschata]|uniref:Ig-like domain-containing protein n=1 Tax=Aromia moschata TaxID=1265417 RepID=A0AAV8Y4W5_9CUCU|nr:hypothetical protein NQ318_012065 [Aromia moschata]
MGIYEVCKLINETGLGRTVSWIRKRDLHILTAGIYTYTSDQRFQVIRPEKSDNWTLQIKFPQLRDSGIYECQVNTEPKMSLAFRLNVIGTPDRPRLQNPRQSIPRSAQELGLSQTSTWRILRRDLELHPYKIELTQKLKVNDHRQRRWFADWASERLEEDPNF